MARRAPVVDARVSIHAPARGATRLACAMRSSRCFNPRPRAGGDKICQPMSIADRTCFNPRPRAGGDARRRSGLSTDGFCFNPRPRAGGDSHRDSVRSRRFNPRPRAGGDRHVPCFNPRPRAGGDQADRTSVCCDVSIHAPARGATTTSSG